VLDYETAQSHTVTLTPVVTGEGQNNLGTKEFTLTVQEADEGPDFGTVPTDLTIDENRDGRTNPIDIVTITATDPDPDDADKQIRFDS